MIPVDDMLPCPWCRAWLPSDHVCPAGSVGCTNRDPDDPPCGHCGSCIAAMQEDPRYGDPGNTPDTYPTPRESA